MNDKAGRLYTSTSFRNGGRRAGAGTPYDDYGDESGGKEYETRSWVKLPHDDIEPEKLNGPVIIKSKE